MKKHLLILFFLFAGYTMQSQVLIALLLGDKLNSGNIEFGLDGGMSISSITGMDSHKNLRSFDMGFYFDIKIKDPWYLNTGVLVKTTLGLDKLTDNDLDFLNATIYRDQDGNRIEGDYSQKMNSFLIPVLAKYKFKNHMYAEAGFQFSWMYNSWIQFDSKFEGNSARIKENNEDITNWFDIGLTAGTGYRLLNGYGWTLGARYYYGLVNVYKDRSAKNSVFFLKLAIPFGVSEKTKEAVKHQKELKKERKAKKKEK